MVEIIFYPCVSAQISTVIISILAVIGNSADNELIGVGMRFPDKNTNSGDKSKLTGSNKRVDTVAGKSVNPRQVLQDKKRD